jgi:hypothetical protein
MPKTSYALFFQFAHDLIVQRLAGRLDWFPPIWGSPVTAARITLYGRQDARQANA